jgi:hypothetical protein
MAVIPFMLEDSKEAAVIDLESWEDTRTRVGEPAASTPPLNVSTPCVVFCTVSFEDSGRLKAVGLAIVLVRNAEQLCFLTVA